MTALNWIVWAVCLIAFVVFDLMNLPRALAGRDLIKKGVQFTEADALGVMTVPWVTLLHGLLLALTMNGSGLLLIVGFPAVNFIVGWIYAKKIVEMENVVFEQKD